MPGDALIRLAADFVTTPDRPGHRTSGEQPQPPRQHMVKDLDVRFVRDHWPAAGTASAVCAFCTMFTTSTVVEIASFAVRAMTAGSITGLPV